MSILQKAMDFITDEDNYKKLTTILTDAVRGSSNAQMDVVIYYDDKDEEVTSCYMSSNDWLSASYAVTLIRKQPWKPWDFISVARDEVAERADLQAIYCAEYGKVRGETEKMLEDPTWQDAWEELDYVPSAVKSILEDEYEDWAVEEYFGEALDTDIENIISTLQEQIDYEQNEE